MPDVSEHEAEPQTADPSVFWFLGHERSADWSCIDVWKVDSEGESLEQVDVVEDLESRFLSDSDRGQPSDGRW